jgi:cysteine-rich repeat protein
VKAPTFAYDHSLGGASANAGAFYAGTTYPAAYRGALFIADYNQRWIRYLSFDAQGRATVHPFATASTGPVQLVAGPDSNLHWVQYSGSGGELRRIRYVGAGNTPPVASFEAAPTVGVTPLEVAFDANASYDPDAQPLAFAWSFGDGGTSALRSPSHVYLTAGSYDATLTVSEQTAPFATSRRSVRITVGNSPPLAAILDPADGASYRVGDVIAFEGRATSGPNPVPAAQLEWELHTLHNQHVHYDALAAAAHPSDAFRSVGSFAVDDHGDDVRLQLCLTATVLPEDVTDTQCVDLEPERTEITLASDPSGLLVSYEDEGVALATPALIYPVVGAVQTLSLLPVQQHRSFVRWADGPTALSRSFTVGTTPRTFRALYENRAPLASFTRTPASGVAPLVVAFDARASSDAEGDALAFAWDAGAAGSASGAAPSIRFAAPGDYTVRLTVSDQLGATGVASALVSVAAPNRPPTARIGGVPAQGLAPLTVVADATGSTDPEAAPLRYDWATSDGQRSTAARPSFRFATPGRYTLTLRVTDPGGLSGQASAEVRVVTPCNDGADNDGDGRVDHPADPGCDGPLDESEVAPVLAVTPEAPALGSVRFGDAAAVELTASNPGGDVLRLGSIALAGADPGFALARLPALPLSLQPGASVRFELRFAPSQAGPLRATVRLTSDDPLAPTRDIVASAVGVAPRCLDGFVDPGELCDDGNESEGDGCDANCTPTACGNGRVTSGEACDDGNAVDGDGCDAGCVPTGCGNGVQTEGEACDDGNATPADGCGVDCAVDWGAQSEGQQRCIAAVNRGLAKLAKAQAAAARRCLRAAGLEREPDAPRAALADCLAAADARIEAVAAAALEMAGRRCPADELPELALGADPLAGLAAARTGGLDLVRALFGDPAQVVPRDRPDASACQRKALKGTAELARVFAREHERALALALAGDPLPPARSDAELAERIAPALAASPRLARAAAALASSAAPACAALPDLPQALPSCSDPDATALAHCLAARSACSACELAATGNPSLGLPCDELDDGVADGSCR